MMNSRCVRCLLLAVILTGLTPSPSLAYVGPGAGITAIGTAFAFVGGLLLAVVGFIWYPVKRLLRWQRRKSAS